MIIMICIHLRHSVAMILVLLDIQISFISNKSSFALTFTDVGDWNDGECGSR